MAVVELERVDDSVQVLRLNRPDVLNALSWELVDELHAALDVLDRDNRTRVVVVTGAGRGFCAGLDLATAGQGATRSEGLRAPAASMRSQNAIASLIPRMRRIPQVLVAAVNGVAFGGGLALALGCDLRVASTSARFCTQFIRIGVSGCDIGVSYLLPKLVGGAKAHELILTSRPFDAEEARQLGLVADVVPDGEVVDRAVALAGDVCRYSPFAVAMTKEVMWANLDAPSLEHAIHLENRTQTLAGTGGDIAEAAAAFFEKREPRWR